MEIKNLSQLKRAINEKKIFVIKRHYIRPDFEGQRRKPNVVQTNGFYSVDADDPNSALSTSNYGKGVWFEYGKASEWKFENGRCIYSPVFNGKIRPVWEIEFE